MSNTENAPMLEVLARRRLDLVEQREAITEAIARVDDELLRLLEPGEVAEVNGDAVWTVRRGARRFKAEKAREVLPAALIDAITVTEPTISMAKAKDVLPKVLYLECTVEGAPSIAAVRP